MTLDWRSIKPLNGSRADGFEELCTQLARTESPNGAKFERKGAPDAGVECFCVLQDGSEWGWQAKYFNTLGQSQWSQIDKSVKKALEKHPAIVRYFVCVSLNRPDPRVDDQMSAMQGWNKHVQKWSGWAKTHSMCVEFVWWGSSELFERLSGSEHIGRVYFWFGQRGFDPHWFQSRLDEAVKAAGPRYTPEVHIDLPIARELERFSRSEFIYNEAKSLAKGIRRKFQDLASAIQSQNDLIKGVSITALSESVNIIIEEIRQIKPNPIDNLPFGRIAGRIESAYEELDKIADALSQHECEHSIEHNNKDTSSIHYKNPFRKSLYYASQYRYQLEDAKSILEHADEIATSKLMLFKGKAGTGKTHLLCDFAKKCIDSGTPTILLMGQRFVSTETPWAQALGQLDLREVSIEKFVGALEVAAQAADRRALFIIDALNEGNGRPLWPDNLAAFLAPLENSPWIGVLLSVRSDYEEVILPDEVRNRAIHVTHHGFDDHEYDATRTFFSYYDLEFPSTPILQPEFRNPLFLKTVCLGLNGCDERRFPRGFHGITAFFDLYLRAINKRLADLLGFDPKEKLVQEALKKLADHLIEVDERWLERHKAKRIVGELLPGREFERSLYRGLVVEGILTESIEWQGSPQHEEITYISYDRFTDHVIADSLLHTHLDVNAPESAFKDGGGLSFICDRDKYVSSGLIEALCVQVPEKIGEELLTLAPGLFDRLDIGEVFRQSVVWRQPKAFSNASKMIFNKLIKNRVDSDDAFNTIMTVSTIENHPFNAVFLDAILRRHSMADRDAWWNIYLCDTWQTHSAVDRLIDWASTIDEDSDLDKRTVELCSLALGWMLTTSNRSLRDRATKALVSLLTGRLDTATWFIECFSDIDDLYVTERVYAVAYGVTMRSHNTIKLKELATLVYKKVFASGEPPVHILLRDYARGVIECALHLGADLSINKDLIKPPYKSTWPKIPDEDEMQPLMPDWSLETNDSEKFNWGRSDIAYSVNDGDFARYVIGTNGYSINWLSLSIDEESWVPPDVRMEALLPILNDSERLAWERYDQAEKAVRYSDWMKIELEHQGSEKEVMDSISQFEQVPSGEEVTNIAEVESLRDSELNNFRMTLRPEHLAEFEAISEAKNKDTTGTGPRFDLKLIQRYVLWRVFDLGWTNERFGRFDHYNTSYRRESSRQERIGKKYQWIAYHEFLAYIADHYQYYEWLLHDKGDKFYDGAWQESLRDIDPSCTLKSIPGGLSWDHNRPTWWNPFPCNNWNEQINHQDWIACKDDIPNVEGLLNIINPENGSCWFNLNGHFRWLQPHPADVESYEAVQRYFWLSCSAYIIDAKKNDDFMDWAKDLSFWGLWMPDSPDNNRMFLGEYRWSPAFQYFDQPYYCSGWTKPEKDCPATVLPAAFRYIKEAGGFDCSVDESYTLHLPVYEVVEGLGLKWSGKGADYLGGDNDLAAFDPAVHEEGPGALLIRKDLLMKYLSDEGLAVCWVILGGKTVTRGIGQAKYYGALQISGAYTYKDDELDGFLNFHFDEPT